MSVVAVVKHLRLLGELRGLGVNGQELVGLDRSTLVDRVTLCG
jgi:hypothetical protein